MSDEYPDSRKPSAERRSEPVQRHVFTSTGSGNRFPLTVQPGPSYPASWGYGPEEVVLDGVVEVFDQDGD